MHSTVNDMLRYLKANMGVEQSPLNAAMKLAQQPRSAMGIVWHNGETGGYRSLGAGADCIAGGVGLARAVPTYARRYREGVMRSDQGRLLMK
jgi:serine-type D-Ala-D-Ala carboxypeptidase/endopeptidase